MDLKQSRGQGGMHGGSGMEERLEDAINILQAHADIQSQKFNPNQQQSSGPASQQQQQQQLTQLDCHVVRIYIHVSYSYASLFTTLDTES